MQHLPKQLSPKLVKLQQGLNLRANSLLITLYGDALSAQKAPISLGSLIELAGLFGLSPRLVRTSAFEDLSALHDLPNGQKENENLLLYTLAMKEIEIGRASCRERV